jgi:hypothetical protein
MLIRHGDTDRWHEPVSSGWVTEASLELLLSESPFLLPWDLSEGLVLASQVGLPTGTADLVGVGVSGEIVVVECKLRSNAEIRRHVVGQVFAYASALWRMPYDTFESAWSKAAKTPLIDSVRAIVTEAGAEWSEEDFRQTVSANLKSGSFRLLVAVDEITEELRGIVEFVNRHTGGDLQLLALQLEYRRDGDVQILLPTIFGQEILTADAKARKICTEEEWKAALQKECSAAGREAVLQLYKWSQANGMTSSWGTGADPSVTAWFNVDGVSIAAWSCWASPRTSCMSVNFAWIAHRGLPPDRVDAFLSALQVIHGFGSKLADVREKDFRKRSGIPIDPVFAAPGAMDAFGTALADLLGKQWIQPMCEGE